MSDTKAAQFAPFASLRGYYDQIRYQEVPTVPRRELSEEAQAVLSHTLCKLKKGLPVAVCYYDGRRYLSCEGTLESVCLEENLLVIIGRKIPISDVICVHILT